MKLAEALSLRADLQKKIASLRERAVSCARGQEGEEVTEDANGLLAEALVLVVQQEELIKQVNRTNGSVSLNGGTLTDAIAQRDSLGAQHKLVTEIADAAAGGKTRGM